MKWYVVSLVLFLVAAVFSIAMVEPILKRMHVMVEQAEGADMPPDYAALFRKKQVRDRVANLLAIAIIVLMVFKPI